jgi:hypothetical protein
VHRVASEMFLKKWGKLGVLLIPKTARGKKQHPKGVSNIHKMHSRGFQNLYILRGLGHSI